MVYLGHSAYTYIVLGAGYNVLSSSEPLANVYREPPTPKDTGLRRGTKAASISTILYHVNNGEILDIFHCIDGWGWTSRSW
jgi:hypothetical protein